MRSPNTSLPRLARLPPLPKPLPLVVTAAQLLPNRLPLADTAALPLPLPLAVDTVALPLPLRLLLPAAATVVEAMVEEDVVEDMVEETLALMASNSSLVTPDTRAPPLPLAPTAPCPLWAPSSATPAPSTRTVT